MTLSKVNASVATLTRNRAPSDVSPFSGMCAACVEGCPGTCEVGRSALRGREVIYPQHYGKMTTASQKDYPVDFSHLNIMGTVVGAHGAEEDSDKAVFSAVDTRQSIGGSPDAGVPAIRLNLPVFVAALGSTEIARVHWESLAAGAALAGTMLVVGENVCGMDPDADIRNGRLVKSPELERRVGAFKRWHDGHGAIAVQANVEDSRLGVLEYAVTELGVDAVEIKWGQGAKNIGGEVKVSSLATAQWLKERGYILLPDPDHPAVQAAWRAGTFKEFERHSRIGMVREEAFMARVDEIREAGARRVFLKTGAYRPADLARAVKFASGARIDLLTVDGAGGGTGMSPWRMMNEWGVPTVYIESLLYECARQLAARGRYVPSLAVAGGFTLEDHIFKGLALGAPFVKAIAMARAPLAAVMVGKTVGDILRAGRAPAHLAGFGTTTDQVFIGTMTLRERLGEDFRSVPTGALGLYNYLDRVTGGLQQLMCGSRKFTLSALSRHDLASLTREAAEVTGIPFLMDTDREEIASILDG